MIVFMHYSYMHFPDVLHQKKGAYKITNTWDEPVGFREWSATTPIM